MPLTKHDRLRALTASFIVMGALALMAVATALVILNVKGNKASDLIVDCTQPGGECYQRGQDGTAKAVQALVDDADNTRSTVVWTEFCSKQVLPPTYTLQELFDCVERYK